MATRRRAIRLGVDDDDDVGLNVLGCRADMLGTRRGETGGRRVWAVSRSPVSHIPAWSSSQTHHACHTLSGCSDSDQKNRKA